MNVGPLSICLCQMAELYSEKAAGAYPASKGVVLRGTTPFDLPGRRNKEICSGEWRAGIEDFSRGRENIYK